MTIGKGPAVPDRIHADVEAVRQLAGRLDPEPATVARAAAQQLRTGAAPCADPLPGCLLLTGTIADIADRITTMCRDAEDGLRAYGSTAQGAAAHYTDGDQAGRTLLGHPGF
jgi:hypothetical protein